MVLYDKRTSDPSTFFKIASFAATAKPWRAPRKDGAGKAGTPQKHPVIARSIATRGGASGRSKLELNGCIANLADSSMNEEQIVMEHYDTHTLNPMKFLRDCFVGEPAVRTPRKDGAGKAGTPQKHLVIARSIATQADEANSNLMVVLQI